MLRWHKSGAEAPAVSVSLAARAVQSRALHWSAVRHQQSRWISPAGPSFIRAQSQLPPNTPPYTPGSHREFTSIYANALWLTLLISFSLSSHYNSSLGRAVKCLKPGHWSSSCLPSVTTTAYDFIGICSQKPSVSIVVQDSTTHLLHGPSVPYRAERKPSLPKKSTVRHTYCWEFCKAKPDFKEALTRVIACLVTRPQK